MKEKILEISDKLRNEEITENEAQKQFLFLFVVTHSTVYKLRNFNMKIENKLKIYKRIIGIFLDKIPSDEIIKNYINDNSDENHEIQDFIGMNLKQELNFATGLSIMDSIDTIFNGAIENNNFNNYSDADY